MTLAPATGLMLGVILFMTVLTPIAEAASERGGIPERTATGINIIKYEVLREGCGAYATVEIPSEVYREILLKTRSSRFPNKSGELRGHPRSLPGQIQQIRNERNQWLDELYELEELPVGWETFNMRKHLRELTLWRPAPLGEFDFNTWINGGYDGVTHQDIVNAFGHEDHGKVSNDGKLYYHRESKTFQNERPSLPDVETVGHWICKVVRELGSEFENDNAIFRKMKSGPRTGVDLIMGTNGTKVQNHTVRRWFRGDGNRHYQKGWHTDYILNGIRGWVVDIPLCPATYYTGCELQIGVPMVCKHRQDLVKIDCCKRFSNFLVSVFANGIQKSRRCDMCCTKASWNNKSLAGWMKCEECTPAGRGPVHFCRECIARTDEHEGEQLRYWDVVEKIKLGAETAESADPKSNDPIKAVFFRGNTPHRVLKGKKSKEGEQARRTREVLIIEMEDKSWDPARCDRARFPE